MDSKSSLFVKNLASNKRQTREAAIESLKQFLSRSKPLPDLEYQKLWKGLFYAMWFSDMPRPQQRLANNLGLLFLETVSLKSFIPFVKLFWVVISREWPGIDQWRIDKFYMLIRRVVYYCFQRLLKEKYDSKLVQEYLDVLKELPLSGNRKIPVALPYHMIDIYVDELEKSMFKDLEGKEEDGEIDESEKDEIIEATPVKKLLEPFEILRKEALLKTLRQKILEDVLQDDRLIAWGIIEKKKSSEKKAKTDEEDSEGEADEEEEEGEDDEWTGF